MQIVIDCCSITHSTRLVQFQDSFHGRAESQIWVINTEVFYSNGIVMTTTECLTSEHWGYKHVHLINTQSCVTA